MRGSGFRARTESDRSAVIMFNSSQTDLPPILCIENEGKIFTFMLGTQFISFFVFKELNIMKIVLLGNRLGYTLTE